jgi:predicted membrane protein DUF2306
MPASPLPYPSCVLRTWALMFFLLALPVGLAAIALALDLIPLPYELHVVKQRLPGLFRAHMIASGLALLLLPLAVATHGRRLHKLLGRIAAVLVIAGGLTALPVAVASEAIFLTRIGFVLQALVWMALLVGAVAAIRSAEPTRHAWLMIAVAAVASGAIWLRLATWVAIASGMPFQATYAVSAWLSWLLPLGSAYLLARRAHAQRTSRTGFTTAAA